MAPRGRRLDVGVADPLMQAAPYGTSVTRLPRGRRAFRTHSRLDLLLLLATLGLIACSLYTISTATTDDIPGSPNYFVIRQAAYVGVGLVLMLIVSRIDYSRLREWKAGLYAADDRLIVVVCAVGAVDARIPALRSSCRFFQLPDLRAGQGAADPRAVGLRGRPHAAARRPRDHQPRSCCWRSSRRCW